MDCRWLARSGQSAPAAPGLAGQAGNCCQSGDCSSRRIAEARLLLGKCVLLEWPAAYPAYSRTLCRAQVALVQTKSRLPTPRDVPASAVVNRLSLYLRELQHLVRRRRRRQLQPTWRQLSGLYRRPGPQGPGLLRPFRPSGDRLPLRGADRRDPPHPGHRSAVDGHAGRRRQPGPGPVGLQGLCGQGFRIVAAFDATPAMVGTQSTGIPVYDRLEQLAKGASPAADSTGDDHRAGRRRPSRSADQAGRGRHQRDRELRPGDAVSPRRGRLWWAST